MQQAWINASRLATEPVAKGTTEAAATEGLPLSGLKRKTDESENPEGSSKRIKLGE
jgi:hypothetical protein